MAEQEPEHGHPDEHRHQTPDSFGSLLANLRGTGLPWRQVLGRAASNMWLKVASRRLCCGNPGQPGC